VELQRNFLRNPLPVLPWICPTCRAVRSEGFPRCLRCQAHRHRSGGRVADLVVPIAYSPRDGQHHHNLSTYKGIKPSEHARWNLLALLLLFLNEHLGCVERAAGSRPTRVAVVPSTRGRAGPHPLAALVGARLDLPWVGCAARAKYGPDEHEFHDDWFAVESPVGEHVLILEDTWTTGARAQSLACALKAAGAHTVSTVVLGRHLDPAFGHAKRLRAAIAGPIFDTTRCAAEDTAAVADGGWAGRDRPARSTSLSGTLRR
jgi:hypothetical protein